MAFLHASLFSGIGGFDIAAEWSGWENAFNCEIDPFCRQVLKYHFPNAVQYEDIKTTDFTVWRGKIDVLTGGFPCQDASLAKRHGGGQQGINGSRTGLVVEMLRAIGEIRPKFVVSENVSNLLRTNGGRDFLFILNRLASMGYFSEWRVTSASEVGAPHRRPRLYMVSYPGIIRLPEGESFFSNVLSPVRTVCRVLAGATFKIGIPWEDELPICLDDYGIPSGLVGTRTEKIKHSFHAPGNAIVPQVAYRIFDAINKYGNIWKTK